MNVIDRPSAFFDALTSGDRARARAAVLAFERNIRGCAHPRVRSALADRSGAALRDILHDYLASVLESPGRMQKAGAALHTWSGLREDVRRFLVRSEAGRQSAEDRTDPYFEIVFRKTREALVTESMFVAVSGRGTLRGFRRADRPEDGRRDPHDRVQARLPRLRAKLDETRERDPPVVSDADVRAQLARVFEIGGNGPRPLYELVNLVFESIEPLPPRVLRRVAADDNGDLPSAGVGVAEVPDTWGAQGTAEAAATQFVASLEPVTVAVVRMHYWGGAARDERQPTLEAIATELGMPLSTVAFEVGSNGRFRRALRRFVQEREIGLDEGKLFLDLVLKKIGAVDISPGRTMGRP